MTTNVCEEKKKSKRFNENKVVLTRSSRQEVLVDSSGSDSFCRYNVVPSISSDTLPLLTTHPLKSTLDTKRSARQKLSKTKRKTHVELLQTPKGYDPPVSKYDSSYCVDLYDRSSYDVSQFDPKISVLNRPTDPNRVSVELTVSPTMLDQARIRIANKYFEHGKVHKNTKQKNQNQIRKSGDQMKLAPVQHNPQLPEGFYENPSSTDVQKDMFHQYFDQSEVYHQPYYMVDSRSAAYFQEDMERYLADMFEKGTDTPPPVPPCTRDNTLIVDCN